MAIGGTSATARKWRSASRPMDDDFEARIVADLVAGLSYRAAAARHGVSVARVIEAHDRAAARMLAPENVQVMLIRSLDTLKTVERAFAGRRGVEARRIVKQARRQQALAGKFILQRAPASRPV
jgi:transposase